MTLSAPTKEELRARYPAFTSAPDALMTAILAETQGAVDESWITADQKPAMLAYAAHLLAAEGYGSVNTVTIEGETYDVTGPLKTVQVGDTRVGFGGDSGSGGSAGASAGDLASSSYGRRYLELLRRSHPPVLVA